MEDESLVKRRPKRSTAGNRMEAALAEFHVEELGQDAQEDVDFVIENDEQDMFEADFESTDEEGAQEDVDAAAEKMVREEDRKTKKAVRSQLDKVTAAAHARQKMTFNPQLAITETSKATPKLKPRVSLGLVLDAETGRVMRGAKRHSQRTHTMLSTSMADARFRDELEKKSTVSRRTKVKVPPPTQAELIARALDMEEGNIKEHRNYLTLEEEKRKKARLVRETVEGPLIRWVSKTEKVKVLVPAPLPPPPPLALSSSHAPSYATQYTPGHHLQTSSMPPTSYVRPSYQTYQPDANSYQMYAQVSYQTNSLHPQYTQPPNPQYPPTSQPQYVEEEHMISKNYVVHESEQREGASRPLWKETMAAMFGDHVDWEELKVYTSKNRPMGRYTLQCPITGLPGKYLDPRTNVPYANIRAYETLTRLLLHGYVWNETLGCYTGSEEQGSTVMQ